MSTSPLANTTPRLRTYAADLDFSRTQNNLTPKAPASATTVSASQTTTTQSLRTNEKIVPPFHTFSHNNSNYVTVANSTKPTQIAPIKLGSGITAEEASRESAPAVIITDTKHKRFKLSQALSQSMGSWWKDKKETALKSKVPKYTVPEAGRRKGVIQKATKETGIASTSDHASVVARIKATKQGARSVPAESPMVQSTIIEPAPTREVSNVTITPKRNITTAAAASTITLARQSSWDSDIQSKVNSLGKTAGEVPSVIVLTGKEFTKIKQQRALVANNPPEVLQNIAARTTTKIVPRVPPLSQSTAAQPEIDNPIVTPSVYSTPSNTETQPENIPTTTRTLERVAFTPIPSARPKIIPNIPPAQTAKPSSLPELELSEETFIADMNTNQPPAAFFELDDVRTTAPVSERRFAPPRETSRSFGTILTQTNNIVYIAFGVLMFIIIAGVGARAYLSTQENTTVSQNYPTDLAREDAPIGTASTILSKTDLIQAFKTNAENNDSLVTLNAVGISGNRLTGPELLSILEAEVAFDFKAAINSVTLGVYRGTPWILLGITDQNTARGGLLGWEKTLYQDVGPLFGIQNSLPKNQFVDEIIDSTDVRILKIASADEELVYGFIAMDKVLITKDTASFLNLKTSLQSY